MLKYLCFRFGFLKVLEFRSKFGIWEEFELIEKSLKYWKKF